MAGAESLSLSISWFLTSFPFFSPDFEILLDLYGKIYYNKQGVDTRISRFRGYRTRREAELT